MIYMWDFGGKDVKYTTHNKFSRGFDMPGTHVLKVTALNDISQQSSDLTVVVQYPIVHVKLAASPVILGEPTVINVKVNGGRIFFIHINYGDGQSETLSSENKTLKITTEHPPERGLPRYLVAIDHVYKSIGDYEITANISNLVSYKLQTTLCTIHEPIIVTSVTTDSPMVFPVPEQVNVTVMIASGKDLQFKWEFTDQDYSIVSKVSTSNTITHFFEYSGDYEVTVKVTNQLYKEPVVAKLPDKFKAVDEISGLKIIEAHGWKKTLLKGRKPDWSTEEIVFKALCEVGSHVTFIFHFGDGHSKSVEGKMNYLFFQISGEASHQYTTEGVYPVYVTAINPLGNTTSYLKEPFHVQRPPATPKLRENYYIQYGQNFTFKVEQIDDENITFDWKFGDLTDVVNSNSSEISHLYQNAGRYNLAVIANDRGIKNTASAKVYVQQKIQGVTLNISSSLKDGPEVVTLSAHAFPKYNGLVKYYKWRFNGWQHGSLKSSKVTTDPFIQHTDYTERYTVTVSAFNNVSNATSSAIILPIQIKKLKILMDGDPLINRTLKFKITTYGGSDISLRWNFGDGTPVIHVNDSSLYVKHVFIKEGVYNVTVLASNSISHASESKQLFVLDRKCFPPEISVHGQNITLTTINKSQQLRFEVEMAIPVCENTTIHAEYSWRLYNSSDNQLVQLEHVARNTFHQKILMIPPCILEGGKYQLEVKVQIKDTIVYRKKTMAVEVLQSPLSAVIKGGIVREITRHDTVLLDGSLSGDVDCTDNGQLRYKWTCSRNFDDASESCFKDNITDVVTFNQSVVVFPAEYFVSTLIEVVINLTVWRDDKNPQSTFQVIKINDKPRSMMLSIYCPQCEKHRINVNERLLLQAVCQGCPENDTQYKWTTHFVYQRYYPRQDPVVCLIKRADGSSFNLMVLENETVSENDTYKDMYIPETRARDSQLLGNNSVINKSLFDVNNTVRRKRQSPFDLPTTPMYPTIRKSPRFEIPFGIPRSRSSYSRRGRTHYSANTPNAPYNAFHLLGTGIVGLEEGTPTNSRHKDRPSYVEPGVDHGNIDRVYNQQSQLPARKVHILEKSSRRAYLFDEQTTTGTHKQSLVIKPDFFRQGLEYIIKVQAKTKDGSILGTAMTTFSINSGPSKGECEIIPDTGTEIITEFKLYCKAWQDQDKPIQYEVSYSFDEDGIKYIIYRGLRHDVNFTLPAGDVSQNHKVTVYISVLDDLLARTSVCTYLLEVQPISLGSGQNLEDFVLSHTDSTNPFGRLALARRRGDDHQLKSCILSLGRCLQRLITSVKYNDNKVTESIQRMLELLQELALRDELEVLQTVQALESLVALSHKFGMDAFEESIKLLKKIEDKLKQFSSPSDDLYIMLHRITSSLIETLAHQDNLFESWAASKMSNEKPTDQETLDTQLGWNSSHDSMVSTEDNNAMTENTSFIATHSSWLNNSNGVKDNNYSLPSDDSLSPDMGLVHKLHEEQIRRMHRNYLEAVIQVHHSLLQREMTFHTCSEGELIKTSKFITTKAVRYRLHDRPVLEISQSKIVLPQKMDLVLKTESFDKLNGDIFLPSQNCYQVHMTKYNFNPYSYNREEKDKIQSEVCSVKILTCNGSQVDVQNLADDNMVYLEIPRKADKIDMISFHQLEKSVMNIHGFNVSLSDRNNSLNLDVELVPVTEGRLFTIAVLINYNTPPTPSQYIKREVIQGNHLQIFLPSGYLNFSGEYFIGLVDAGLNTGRPREGEVTLRNYTLKLWWNKCLFWNDTTRHWSDNGCWATGKSSYYKTHCRCNHMTAFGGHFELVPNDFSHISIEDFFDLNENPVAVCLTGVLLLLYVLLMVLCHRLDKHDARKGGITYLIDNNLTDKQKYEVTIETGFRKGAGTTAKISVILHGEEGMSETRELISDDDRPLFERNSRDQFILTLPDSIGKIWKVQLWHNNHGASPSWYLSRVIVKDLNSGSTYYFISEKWLAVEEDDGKVEREFMALEGNLGFRKAFWTKGTQYFSDYHLWMSLVTCPSYSQFNRKQRLTCGLTLLMMYMCLNAMWYKEIKPEYRGEFGLLDVSLRNITVGAICCGVVIPVNLLILLLFRRSKKEQSGYHNEPIPDEEKEDEQFASGKPNEHVQEEEEVESVQPIMTYSILDQSILNWPSIQDWAQKQWVKRHQGYQETSNSPEISQIPNQIVQRRILGSEIDQASSGFEDSNSTDPRRQVTISSQNSSQKMKAPSVSSGSSQKGSSCSSRKVSSSRLFLPYWCQFIAWFLCVVITGTCAVITVMYGFRFGISKSMMWLQSLYFSFMVCVFIAQPFMIIIAVIYTAIRYKNDPSILDHYEDGEFGEKAKLEILRRKKEQVQYTEQEELERGVAARQRSRYLRFARPPQEKQLIEARKKIMKEKKAMSLLRDTAVIFLMFIMLIVMAYGKDTSSPFYINQALKNSLIRSGPLKFTNIKFSNEWYNWSQTTMLDKLYPPAINLTSHQYSEIYQLLDNSHIIGNVQLRQLKVIKENCDCPYNLPFLPDSCYHDYQTSKQMKSKGDKLSDYKEATLSFNIYGKHGIYDNSGYVLQLNMTRSEVLVQLEELQQLDWINNQTRAVIVEFTLYNAPTGLFTSVVILLEIPSSGGAYPDHRIRSTHLYRYVTKLDNLVLAFELMFIILTVYKIGVQLCDVVRLEIYFRNFWVVVDTISSALSLTYIVFYVYRFILVSETVENLRSTYFRQFVDVSFLAFWDEIIRSLIGMILFLVMIKFLKLLHYIKIFSMFGTIYKRLQREIVTFMALFLGSIVFFSRIGTVLFGAYIYSFSNVIGSIFTVSALLTGIYEDYPIPDTSVVHTIRIFVLFFSVFGTGLLTSYMLTVLTYRFRIQKHKHSVFLMMEQKETVIFYWKTFLLWTGFQSLPVDEEPENVLPPEFTMAEVEYQVDELFFRINTLTGSHGLPEKPTSYFTDSDETYGLGDDGISSGGSEVNLEDDERLENRLHKIEDSLCSHEHDYLAHLLKLSPGDGMTKGREKQIRTNLEMEIFRQLQKQRHSLPDKVIGDSSKSSTDTSGTSSEMTTPFGDRKSGQTIRKPVLGVSGLQHHTFVHHADISPVNDVKDSPQQTRMDTTSSSSNPDSPDEQLKNADRVRLLKDKGCKKSTSKVDENISQDKNTSSKMKKPEPPHKPTFHHPGLRDVQSQETAKSNINTAKSSVLNSPALRQLRSSLQAIERDRHSFKGESGSSVTTESSSGSEQDAIHGKGSAQIKRNLRKTKSRGKGKGSVNLTSVLLDDLDTSNDELGAAGTSFKISETEPILEQEHIEDYYD
ncbi:polycystic kidney disease protein 1-like 1 isoform X3 [Mytilus californianus]|nr:polycystic kidney disease protein 1-like 1 isoform X3 [Mytilus californianus]